MCVTGLLRVFAPPRRLPQMLSDERLAKAERLVSESLNEGASLQKVSPSDLTKASQQLLSQTGIAAVNARVFAVKVTV